MKGLDWRTALVLVLVFGLGYAAAVLTPKAQAEPRVAAGEGQDTSTHGAAGQDAQFVTSYTDGNGRREVLWVVRQNAVYRIEDREGRSDKLPSWYLK